MILCPEAVSRNMTVPRNLPKSSLNMLNRHKYLSGQKTPKNPNFIWPFFKTKVLIKGQNYKFGLKKAKLATLLIPSFAPFTVISYVTRSFNFFVLAIAQQSRARTV